ncbi:MAG: tryptophan--tRNA ligase [Rhodospirillaceae bacterium]|jgi:tryptophanyl-tRNA synthetase|nr:tryptophan--tRNA ligase [Rhodospirillaceae bacterium]
MHENHRIFSGIQPTGNLHLGNYLGALRNWVSLQNDHECIFCVVDMHAITVWQDPIALRAQTREVAAALLAAGIDTKKHILFTQSQNPNHAQLAWILNCVTRIGWLNRMTQFKEKAGKNRQNSSVGLYVYPNLMSADILVYKATRVPVGEDQKQHVELARDTAHKFNNDYGVITFPLPEPLILGSATRVMSLRDGTKKMSKSDELDYSRINMIDDADTINLKLRKAKTDSLPMPDNENELIDRPEAINLLNIWIELSNSTREKAILHFAGRQFFEFKKELIELMISILGPINTEMKRYLMDPATIDSFLKNGADRARELSMPILAEVENIVGFLHI